MSSEDFSHGMGELRRVTQPGTYEFCNAVARLGELQACCEKGEPWARAMFTNYAGGKAQIAEDLRAVLAALSPKEGA